MSKQKELETFVKFFSKQKDTEGFKAAMQKSVVENAEDMQEWKQLLQAVIDEKIKIDKKQSVLPSGMRNKVTEFFEYMVSLGYIEFKAEEEVLDAQTE